jgi:uncharacterized protein (TIGR03000 family)
MRRTFRLLPAALLGCGFLLAPALPAESRAAPPRPGRRPGPFGPFTAPFIAPYIDLDLGNLAYPPIFPPSRASINIVPGPGLQPPGAPSDDPEPPPPPAAPADRAVIQVVVPDAAAEVWFANYRTNSSGRVRSFTSPELVPGKGYHYTVKVTWRQGGRVLSEERKVEVAAGRVSVVDFTRPPGGSLPPPRED